MLPKSFYNDYLTIPVKRTLKCLHSTVSRILQTLKKIILY